MLNDFDLSRLHSLSPAEFTAFLKKQILKEEFEKAKDELTIRVKEGNITQVDLILAILNTDVEFIALNQAIINHLSNQPELAVSIISNLPHHTKAIGEVSFICYNQFSPFEARYKAKMEGKYYTTEDITTRNSKKDAKNQAALLWLIEFLDNDLIQEDLAALPSEVKAKESLERGIAKPIATSTSEYQESRDYVSELNLMCQKLKWNLPDYDTRESSGGYACICTTYYKNERIEGKGSGTSKRIAKKKAAASTLNQLNLMDDSK